MFRRVPYVVTHFSSLCVCELWARCRFINREEAEHISKSNGQATDRSGKRAFHLAHSSAEPGRDGLRKF